MYRLRPGWVLERKGNDVVHVLNEDRCFALRAKRITIEELDAHLGMRSTLLSVAAEKIIEELIGIGAVIRTDPDDADATSQFSRQVEFLRAFSDDAAEAQLLIESATILVLGLGGIGSEFLRLVVAAGVRNYVLVDQDVVEVSNLNRQTIYTLSDIGETKADVCARYVAARLRSYTCVSRRNRIDAADQVRDLVTSYRPNLALIAVDEPAADIHTIVADALRSLGCPFLVAGAGVRHVRAYSISQSIDVRNLSVVGTRASIGTTNAIAAAYAAHTAVEFLSGVSLPFRMHHEP